MSGSSQGRGDGSRAGGVGRWAIGALTLAGVSLLGAAPALADDEGMGPGDPIAGFTDGTAFLRSPDNQFVLLPSGRLQVDGYAFVRPTSEMPEATVLLRRARLELAGWVGSWFYYSIAGDFALGAPAGADPRPQSFIATTDDFVAVAPLKDKVILQVGQFDAPFTLENRTSDKYFDFMERSLAVRAFGVPGNKDIGVMAFGTLPKKLAYYSVGVFDGEGQNIRNQDNYFAVIGRAFVSPLAPWARLRTEIQRPLSWRRRSSTSWWACLTVETR